MNAPVTVPAEAAQSLNASRDERLAELYRIVNYGLHGFEVQVNHKPIIFNEYKGDTSRNWHAALKWARENVKVTQ